MLELDKDDAAWGTDLLSFSEIGSTFTNLIKSIDGTKVISIEAGFGHGKTFFRTEWAKHLRKEGEIVVEIDAQQSDHSGEPIVTFLGALIAITPPSRKPIANTIKESGLKLAGVVGRSVAHAILKNGAEEMIETAESWLSGQAQGVDALKEAVADLSAGMSKYAGQLIAAQLAAEQARQKELPEQIDSLRDAITQDAEHRRIVIIIDELDRCHPDYAIALLEAMKLVFGRAGFVFCLMVNPEYLESIAHHRFGTSGAGERYLDKFVDLRLVLGVSPQTIGRATENLVGKLRVETPFGVGAEFSIASAAGLAAKLAEQSELSFRQVKRIIDRVDLALRCYRARPLDVPLLFYLAFADVAKKSDGTVRFEKGLLPRAALSPTKAKQLLESTQGYEFSSGKSDRTGAATKFIRDSCSELLQLQDDRYGLEPPSNGGTYYDWYKVLHGLGPRYLPEHQEVLASVHQLLRH